MSRTERKCLVASTSAHALLIALVVASPLLLPAPRRAPDMQLLKVVPLKVVDALMSGGGNPKAPPVEAPAVETPPAAGQPQATPPEPEPPRPEPAVTPPEPTPPEPTPPARPESRTQPEPEPQPEASKPAKSGLTPDKPKRTVQVNTELTRRTNKELIQARERAQKQEQERQRAAAAAAAASAARQRQQRADQAIARLDGAVGSLTKGLSGSTAVEIQGPGGEAYANYTQVIYSLYYNAWLVPAEAADSTASVRVRIVVGRDGTILSQEVLSRSGNAALDRSVQSAVDRVRLRGLPAFPDTATDAKRTFILKFNPAEKLGSG